MSCDPRTISFLGAFLAEASLDGWRIRVSTNGLIVFFSWARGNVCHRAGVPRLGAAATVLQICEHLAHAEEMTKWIRRFREVRA